MINVSNAFKEKLADGGNLYLVVDVTYADGTTDTWDDEIMYGQNDLVDGASSSSFAIGVAIEKYITLSIDNREEQFIDRDLYGAVLKPSLKLELDDGKVESVRKGTYTVTTPEEYGEIITITAVDDMYKADKDYETSLPLPQTLISLVRDACSKCDIALYSTSMTHGGYIVNEIPDGLTFRNFFAYAAMIECANARIDINGYLRFVKWDFEQYTETVGAIVGKAIVGEAEVGVAEGINTEYEKIRDFKSSPTFSSDDVVITGVKVTYSDEEYQYGEDGYVLSYENKLAQPVEADDDGNKAENADLKQMAEWLGDALIGATFRTMNGDIFADPTVEFGDMAVSYKFVASSNETRVYRTPITDVSFALEGYTTIQTQAEDPIRLSSSYNSATAQTLVEARQLVQQERSEREKAVERLADRLANSSGMYITVDVQPDGSSIYYMHNKPTLEESDIVWKLTAEAFGISTDGGKTYPYGFTVDGELITRLLYAEGIDADYITTGSITVTDVSGNVIFQADIGTHSLYVNTDQFTLDKSGNATFSGELKAPSGTIGDWHIGKGGLYSDYAEITPSNLVYSDDFTVDANGHCIAKQFDAVNNIRLWANGYQTAGEYIEIEPRKDNGGLIGFYDYSSGGSSTLVGGLTRYARAEYSFSCDGLNLFCYGSSASTPSFVAIGDYSEWRYIMNAGLNPWGYTQRHIFRGTAVFTNYSSSEPANVTIEGALTVANLITGTVTNAQTADALSKSTTFTIKNGSSSSASDTETLPQNVTVDISGILSSYVTSSSLNSTLGNYVTSSSLSNTLGTYATQSWVEGKGYLTSSSNAASATKLATARTFALTFNNSNLSTGSFDGSQNVSLAVDNLLSKNLTFSGSDKFTSDVTISGSSGSFELEADYTVKETGEPAVGIGDGSWGILSILSDRVAIHSGFRDELHIGATTDWEGEVVVGVSTGSVQIQGTDICLLVAGGGLKASFHMTINGSKYGLADGGTREIDMFLYLDQETNVYLGHGYKDSLYLGKSSEKIHIGNDGCETTVAGAFSPSSDKRLKTAIQPLKETGVDNLAPVSFKWKNGDDRRHYGYIAQDVQEHIPELVHEDADGMLGIAYFEIIPLLHTKIIEQQSIIELLEERVAKLEAIIYGKGK